MDPALDVIVVGGGLAGLTAARELGRRGRHVLLLEARERLGGRTWVSSFAGVDVEMGGAFVHWSQPHLWAEVTRYGLGIVELPEAERAFLRTDDGIEEIDPDAFIDLAGGFERLCAGTEAYLAEPMSIPEGPDAVDADLATTAERIAALDLDPRRRDLLDALCAALSSAPNDRVGFLTIARSFALAGFVGKMLFDTNGRWVLEGGTATLVDAIRRDLRADVRLGTRVEEITQDETSVTVRTTDGAHVAPAAIVALPVNALGAVRFDPSLSEPKREAAEEGLVSLGVKVWAKLAGGIPSMFGAAPDRFPLSFVETVGPTPDGGSVVLGFGPSAEALSPDDPEPVAGAIEELLPGARVEEVGGHDWVRDPLAGETWASYGPGRSLRWLPELERREGRVAFAGGDFARGWGSYMDGAIETGLRAGREIEAVLS
ncbi:MAG: amine oxidase [Actinomycetia bacterium]|jgi:monoamine oxidase|nr:amine oxidase [Actinomycetes bacterium]